MAHTHSGSLDELPSLASLRRSMRNSAAEEERRLQQETAVPVHTRGSSQSARHVQQSAKGSGMLSRMGRASALASPSRGAAASAARRAAEGEAGRVATAAPLPNTPSDGRLFMKPHKSGVMTQSSNQNNLLSMLRTVHSSSTESILRASASQTSGQRGHRAAPAGNKRKHEDSAASTMDQADLAAMLAASARLDVLHDDRRLGADLMSSHIARFGDGTVTAHDTQRLAQQYAQQMTAEMATAEASWLREHLREGLHEAAIAIQSGVATRVARSFVLHSPPGGAVLVGPGNRMLPAPQKPVPQDDLKFDEERDFSHGVQAADDRRSHSELQRATEPQDPHDLHASLATGPPRDTIPFSSRRPGRTLRRRGGSGPGQSSTHTPRSVPASASGNLQRTQHGPSVAPLRRDDTRGRYGPMGLCSPMRAGHPADLPRVALPDLSYHRHPARPWLLDGPAGTPSYAAGQAPASADVDFQGSRPPSATAASTPSQHLLLQVPASPGAMASPDSVVIPRMLKHGAQDGAQARSPLQGSASPPPAAGGGDTGTFLTAVPSAHSISQLAMGPMREIESPWGAFRTFRGGASAAMGAELLRRTQQHLASLATDAAVARQLMTTGMTSGAHGTDAANEFGITPESADRAARIKKRQRVSSYFEPRLLAGMALGTARTQERAVRRAQQQLLAEADILAERYAPLQTPPLPQVPLMHVSAQKQEAMQLQQARHSREHSAAVDAVIAGGAMPTPKLASKHAAGLRVAQWRLPEDEAPLRHTARGVLPPKALPDAINATLDSTGHRLPQGAAGGNALAGLRGFLQQRQADMMGQGARSFNPLARASALLGASVGTLPPLQEDDEDAGGGSEHEEEVAGAAAYLHKTDRASTAPLKSPTLDSGRLIAPEQRPLTPVGQDDSPSLQEAHAPESCPVEHVAHPAPTAVPMGRGSTRRNTAPLHPHRGAGTARPTLVSTRAPIQPQDLSRAVLFGWTAPGLPPAMPRFRPPAPPLPSPLQLFQQLHRSQIGQAALLGHQRRQHQQHGDASASLDLASQELLQESGSLVDMQGVAQQTVPSANDSGALSPRSMEHATAFGAPEGLSRRTLTHVLDVPAPSYERTQGVFRPTIVSPPSPTRIDGVHLRHSSHAEHQNVHMGGTVSSLWSAGGRGDSAAPAHNPDSMTAARFVHHTSQERSRVRGKSLAGQVHVTATFHDPSAVFHADQVSEAEVVVRGGTTATFRRDGRPASGQALNLLPLTASSNMEIYQQTQLRQSDFAFEGVEGGVDSYAAAAARDADTGTRRHLDGSSIIDRVPRPLLTYSSDDITAVRGDDFTLPASPGFRGTLPGQSSRQQSRGSSTGTGAMRPALDGRITSATRGGYSRVLRGIDSLHEDAQLLSDVQHHAAVLAAGGGSEGGLSPAAAIGTLRKHTAPLPDELAEDASSNRQRALLLSGILRDEQHQRTAAGRMLGSVRGAQSARADMESTEPSVCGSARLAERRAQVALLSAVGRNEATAGPAAQVLAAHMLGTTARSTPAGHTGASASARGLKRATATAVHGVASALPPGFTNPAAHLAAKRRQADGQAAEVAEHLASTYSNSVDPFRNTERMVRTAAGVPTVDVHRLVRGAAASQRDPAYQTYDLPLHLRFPAAAIVSWLQQSGMLLTSKGRYAAVRLGGSQAAREVAEAEAAAHPIAQLLHGEALKRLGVVPRSAAEQSEGGVSGGKGGIGARLQAFKQGSAPMQSPPTADFQSTSESSSAPPCTPVEKGAKPLALGAGQPDGAQGDGGLAAAAFALSPQTALRQLSSQIAANAQRSALSSRGSVRSRGGGGKGLLQPHGPSDDSVRGSTASSRSTQGTRPLRRAGQVATGASGKRGLALRIVSDSKGGAGGLPQSPPGDGAVAMSTQQVMAFLQQYE